MEKRLELFVPYGKNVVSQSDRVKLTLKRWQEMKQAVVMTPKIIAYNQQKGVQLIYDLFLWI